jgi:hypothetical protein
MLDKSDTYFARSQVELPTSGRYATEPAQSSFLAQPPNSPWASDPVPKEPPLGIDVNAPIVVGTAAEIAASIRRLING